MTAGCLPPCRDKKSPRKPSGQSGFRIFYEKTDMSNESIARMLERLQGAGASLRESPGSAATKDEIRALEAESGFQLPAGFAELYCGPYNGFNLHWEWSTDADRVSGHFGLMPFERMIQSHEQVDLLWSTWYEEEDIERIKEHRVIESSTGADACITAKFSAAPRRSGYQLYYAGDGYVNDGGPEDLPEIALSIEDYIRVVTEYCGVYRIRYHLHEADFDGRPFEVCPALNGLQTMFADFAPPRRP